MKRITDPRLRAVWNATHRDFKGIMNGERTIMIYRNGTMLVPLTDLTDAEIETRTPKERN